MRRLPSVLFVLVLSGLILGACGGQGGRSSSSAATPPNTPSNAAPAVGVPAFSHVFLIVMENDGYGGALAQPGAAALARSYAVATNYDAVAHPSLPNYLALTSGRTWVGSDCLTCYVDAPNLASQAAAAGVSWGAYMEGLPSTCWLGPLWPPGRYAGKHDPFRYYTGVRQSRTLCRGIQPLTALEGALGGGGAGVPRLVWITPDLCHDGHDCSAAVADQWLGGFVPRITASPAWRDGGVLFVTWDEAEGGDDAGGGGHVLTLVIAPGLTAGLRVDVPYSHYSLLATVEAGLGLPRLGHAADAGTAAMSAFWTG